MPLTAEELFKPKTRDEVLEEMLLVADAEALPARSWQPGSIARTILVIVAAVMSIFTLLRVEFARAGFLDWARGAWLTILAEFLYGVPRQLATFADGTITLTNLGGEAQSWAPGDLHFAHIVTGKTYTIQEGAGGTYGPTLGPTESRTYAILADEAGSASTAGPGAITIMIVPLQGVVATNAASLVGLDDELDEALRARSREKLGSLSPNGPADAFSYLVKSDNPRFGAQTSTRITRAKTYLGTDNEVHTIVAGAGGSVDLDDVAILQTRVDRWASPIPFTSIVDSSVDVVVDVVGAMTLKGSTMTKAQVDAAIESAAATFLSLYPIGGYDTTGAGEEGVGYLDVDAIKSLAFQAIPGIVKLTLSSPVGEDIPLDYNETAVLGDVDIAVTVLV